MRRGWIILIAVVGCLALLVTAVLLIGNNGVQATEWRAYTPEDQARPDAAGLVAASQGILSPASCVLLPEYEGRQNVVRLSAGGSVSCVLNAPETGMYGLRVGYHTESGKGVDMEYSLQVDGQPYNTANAVVSLNRIWTDAGQPERTPTGNELRPKQVEAFLWTEALLADTNEVEGQVLLQLEKGDHEITLTSLREEAVLDYLALQAQETLPTYAEYKAANAGLPAVQNVEIILQAENALSKSASAIYPTYDRTSSFTQPYHPTQMRLNTIGGSGWKQVGQWVEWLIDAPEDGLYQLGMRYHQNQLKGFFVARQVMLDGQVPFREMQEVHFAYRAEWVMDYLADDSGNPYLFALTKGPHILRMQVTLGEMAPVISDMQDTVYSLNELYRQIIMVTGTEPDFYRDYYLERVIPNLESRLSALADALDGYQTTMDEMLGGDSTAGEIIQVLSYQLRDFAKEPYTIQKRLTTFSSNISSFAEWILSVQEQPLEIDYLTLASQGTKPGKTEDNLIDTMKRELRAFVGSFVQDYNAFSSADAEDGKRQQAITVWLSAGRDQAYAINRLIQEDFTAKTGISVNLQLVSGALLKATIAGQGPDVNLFTGRGEVMNLAFREALADLSKLPGYAETAAQLRASAEDPYAFNGGVYGLAETQDFLMMFIRDDVLTELELDVPETWQDLLNIAPILQSNNLQIGLPYTQLGGATVISNGVGMTSLFPSLLLQMGGKFYTDDYKATLLSEPVANAAFRSWTDFYTLYDYPLYKDDFTRFRTGEMPVIITSYNMYARLKATAPEIAGKWSMHLMPGTQNPDGTVNHATTADGTAAIILSSSKNVDASWQFVQWWTNAGTQTSYARDIESDIGTLGRYTSANVEAFELSNWSLNEQQTMNEQWAHVVELPEIPGGYYVSRNLDNAFRAVVLSGNDARESLFYWTSSTNEEIARKRHEMGLND